MPTSRHGFPLPSELIIEIAAHILLIHDLNAFMQTCLQTHYALATTLFRAAMNPHQLHPKSKRKSLRFHHLERVTRRGDAVTLARMLEFCAEKLPEMDHRLINGVWGAALRAGPPAVVALLLDHGVDVGTRVRAGGRAHLLPMHIAVKRGSGALMRLLVARGADANDCLRWRGAGWTPLHEAAYMADARLVGALLALGADPGRLAFPFDRITPLRVALQRPDYSVAVVAALVAAGADTVECGAAHVAAVSGKFDCLGLFLRAGADPAALYEAKHLGSMVKGLMQFPRSTREYFNDYCLEYNRMLYQVQMGRPPEEGTKIGEILPPGAQTILDMFSMREGTEQSI